MNIDKNVEEDGVIFMSIKGDEQNTKAPDAEAKKAAADGEASGGKGKEDVVILAIESSCDESAAAIRFTEAWFRRSLQGSTLKR